MAAKRLVLPPDLASSRRAEPLGNDRFTICHVTGSPTNPYVKISIDGTTLAKHIAHGDVDLDIEGECPAPTPADATAPILTASVVPAPNTAGWNSGPVTVTVAATDPEPGIGSSVGPGTITVANDTTGTILTASATNGAGLVTTKSVTIKIDSTAPLLTAAMSAEPNAAGWHHAPVTVSFAASDPQSGIAASTGLGARTVATDTASNDPERVGDERRRPRH